MKYTLLILGFIFSLSTFANNDKTTKAKTFSITGKVIDKQDALMGVKVILDGKEVVVYTDMDGNFKINNVKEGNHTLSFDMLSYEEKTIVVNPTLDQNLIVKLYGR